MKRSTFSVLFFMRKTRVNKQGKSTVEMRITVDGGKVDASINRQLDPKLWDAVKGCAKKSNQECRELNAYIDSVRSKLFMIHQNLQVNGEPINARLLLDRLRGVASKPTHTIMQIFKEHNDQCVKLCEVKEMAAGTVERYKTSLSHTAEFMKHTYGVDDMDITKIDHKFIKDYEFYLKTERRCSHNTTTKYLKNFKKIILLAMRYDYIAKDPFAGIKFHLDPIERDFIEMHELKKLIGLDIENDSLRRVRDVFVFCCFTALAFSDVSLLRKEHLVKDNDGDMWIRKKRQKTGIMCNIPILPEAQKILDKYANSPYCKGGQVLPVLSNTKFNTYIKAVIDLCGINKDVSTHTARHTAATIFLANGVSIENVAKMLGHTDTKMTRHYAKVLDQSIKNDMKLVGKALKLKLSK